jgi:hypothetical protein
VAQASRAQALVVGPLTLHTPCIFSAQYRRPKSKARALRRQAPSTSPGPGRCFVSLHHSHRRKSRTHERAAALEEARRRGREEPRSICRPPPIPGWLAPASRHPARQARAAVPAWHAGSTAAGRRAGRRPPLPTALELGCPLVCLISFCTDFIFGFNISMWIGID